MGILEIMYAVLLLFAVVLQLFLYRNKDQSKIGIFFLNGILGILLAYLVLSSLPNNYKDQRIVALVIGSLSIIGLGYKVLYRRDKFIGKIMISLSIFLGFLQLLI